MTTASGSTISANQNRQLGKEAEVSLRDWIVVLGACLGAFMAVLDIQITNSSLADIQGSLGATIDEGSWISTSYLIAEIIVIPLSAWLSRAFGFKQFLLVNTALFVVFSCFCGLARDLTSMIIFRAVQGFTGGVLIPLAMQLILQRLPESKQTIGLALFGVSATFAPAIGPSLGGWITDNYGWPFVFYLNVVPGAALVAVLGAALDKTKAQLDLLKNGDWFGIIFMAVGLGCLETVLEEGNRKDWLGSELIVQLAVTATVSLIAALIIELRVRNPFVDLQLFAKRNFLLSSIANLAIGAGLYAPTYLTPVYLSQLHGYNAAQTGQVMIWFGVPQLFVNPLVPMLMKKVDQRALIFFGLLLFVVGFALNIPLNNDFAGPQLALPQIVRAIGLPFIFIPLSGVATAGIEPAKLGSASALYNMTRNLGGSFGIAGAGTLLTLREKFHSQFMGESISSYSPALQERLDSLAASLTASGNSPGLAQQQSIAIIDATIRKQANLLAFSDCFFILSFVLAIGALAVLFLERSNSGVTHGMH
ncbi:MAG TPA: DHA2 family efflux MFS transporter permease subunit [Oculatellaceae cyanobacterium]